MFAIFLGATSAINAAVRIPIGAPIKSAPSVDKIDATILGKIPYWSALGTHEVPVKKSINEYPCDINGVSPL